MLFATQSIRLDEAQTLWQTNRFPAGILHVVAQDVHVPLYHLAVHFWQLVFGNSIESVRNFSLLFFLISIPLVYRLGKETFVSTRVALMGCMIFSLSPFMNWYANEARMYSLLVFISLLNHYLFIRLRKSGSPMLWYAYTLSAIAGMYTHYFFVLILVTQIIFFLLNYRNFPKGAFVRFVLSAISVGFALLPWILYVRSLGSMSNSRPLLHSPTVVDIFTTLTQYLFGTQSVPINSFIVALWPLIMLVWFFTLHKAQAKNIDSNYLIMLIILPIMITFFLSLLIRPVFEARYLAYIFPAIGLLIASTIGNLGIGLRRIINVAIVASLSIALVVLAENPNTPIKENYRGATEYLKIHATPSDVIIVSAPFTIYPLDYYYQGSTRITTLPLWDRYATGPIPPLQTADIERQVKEITGTYERVWLLLSYDQGYESEIRNYFNNHYEMLEKKELSPNMSLALYKLRYDTSNIVTLTTNPLPIDNPGNKLGKRTAKKR
ncbi:MAG: glycosyltransferase family 39 protein [bacterium]|nr:glycosyltransferase family 39 protein [bacterium]